VRKTQKRNAKPKAKTKHKNKEVQRPHRRRTMLDILIYVCGVLVIVGGLCLGYMGVSGSLKNQRILALEVLYVTLVFVLTGAFLYFYQNLRSQGVKEAGLHLINRASVAIQSANLTVFELNKNTEALITFVNSGKTTATNVRVYGHIQLRDKPLDPGMPGAKDIKEEPSQDVIPANGGTTNMPFSSGSMLTPNLLKLIDNGSHRIYIWGIVTYEDAIGERWTKFCMIQYRKSPEPGDVYQQQRPDK
jgi:hypothetical protein